MLQRLQLPEKLEGAVWQYAHAAAQNRRHRHAELELNLVTRGRGTYLVGNRRYEIFRGDLLWLFPAEEHVLIEQTEDFEMWIAVFRRRAIRKMVPGSSAKALLQRTHSGECCRKLSPAELGRCEHLLGEIAVEPQDAALTNAGLSYALLSIWSAFERAANVPVRQLHPAVERAAWLIRNEEAERSLAEIAHEAALSVSRLSRLFRQQTGTTMVEFRNRQRLERFRQLYGDGRERKLLGAALEAGFGSYAQFHRVFRKVVGCSPAEYHRRNSG